MANPRVYSGVLAACGLGLLPMVGGCEGLPSGKPPPRISSERADEQFKVSDDDFGRLGYRRDWTGYPGASRGHGFDFVDAYDDLIVMQDGTSTVCAIEAPTGRKRWSNTLATPLTDFVGNTRIGDVVYSCSESEVFALQLATGELTARQPLSKTVSTHPVLVGDTLIFGTPSGHLLAHYLGQSVTLWGNTTEGAIERDLVTVGDAVGAVSQIGRIMFVDKNTGTVLGRASMYDGSDCDPAASDTLMFVASRDHSLYAFSPRGNKPAWRKRTSAPLKFSPAHHNGAVWCALPDQGMTAFFADSGTQRWAADGVQGEVVGMRGGKLLVWDGATAHLLDPERGDIYETATLPGVSMLVTDKFEDGNLYAVSDLGIIVKFIPRS
jgi:outer membrane protein assembly factor BamB